MFQIEWVFRTTALNLGSKAIMPHKDPEKRKECKKRWADKNKEIIRQRRKNMSEEKKAARREYVRLYNRKWREENKERSRETVRKCSTKNKEKYKQLYQDNKENHPEKFKARDSVGNAVRSKKITKPSKCSACESTENIEGHHADYDKPLEVIWLCSRCHKRLHAEIK